MLYFLKNKYYIGIILFIVYIGIFSEVTFAKKLSLENDGKPRKNVNDCYGQSKEIPASYENVKYYDCYVPYQETPDSIGGELGRDTGDYGGVANAQIQKGGSAEYVRYLKVGNWTSQEGFYDWKEGGGSAYHDGSIEMLKANNGLLYYILAPPEYFYMNEQNYVKKVNKSPFIHWGSNRGQMLDVVLTSGDVVHFVVGDNNASDHSNGPVRKESFSGSNAAKCKLKLENYAHLFNGCSGNILELWGNSSTPFRNKFGLNGNVHIAFLRMYNAKVNQNVKVADIAKNAKDKSFFHLDVEGGNNKHSGNNSDDGGGNEDETEVSITTTSPIPDEWDLHGMPDKAQIKDEQQPVDLPQGIGDTSYDVKMQEVKENMGAAKQNRVSYIVRVLVVSLGLLILVYMALLIGCWIMDKANNIFDFSFVTIITFGIIKPTEAEAREGGVLGAKRLIIICIFCLIVAFLLITGGIYDIGQFLLNKISAIV